MEWTKTGRTSNRPTSLRVVAGLASGGMLAASLVALGLTSAAATTVIARPLTPNAPATALSFASVDTQAKVTVAALAGQQLQVVTSAGTFAANCDVAASVTSSTGTVLQAPVFGGQAATLPTVTAPSNGIYTVLVVPTATLKGTLSLKVKSASGGPTITANAAAITVSIPAGGTFTYKSPVVAGRQQVSTFLSKIVGTDPASCQSPAYGLDLINPSGSVVALDEECSKSIHGFAELDPTKTAVTGARSVRIRNTKPATDSYTVAFYSFRDKTVAGTTGLPATLSAPTLGQNVYITVPATASQAGN